MSVSIVVVRGILAELRRRGVDAQAWLRESGLDQGTLTDLRASISVEAWDPLLHKAMTALDDPGLGLSVGFAESESMLQLVGYMLLSSRTPQEAFDLCQRYSSLIVDNLHLELAHVGERAHFRFVLDPALSPHALRFGEELIMAMAFRVVRRHTPDGRLPELCFRQPPPPYRDRFEKHFGCEVRFSCDDNAVIFDHGLLQQTQPHGDGRVIETLTGMADRLLRERRVTPSLVDRVRLVLSHEPELRFVDAERIATKVGLNSRALSRRLRAEGANLRALIDEERMRAAFSSLSNPNATIKDAAERLGYSEPSAFHRAFKRWSGKTPAAFMGQ